MDGNEMSPEQPQPGQTQPGRDPGQGPGEPARPAGRAGLAARWGERLRGVSRVRLAAIGGATVAVIVGLSVAGATVASGNPTSRPPAPAKAFSLSVLGHPARHISLASLSGRPVILNFFASWCGPCQRETPMIARFYLSHHGRPAVLGIDVNDSAAKAQAFIRTKGVRYPVVVDPLPMRTAIAYDLPGLPATFFLNSRHQIVKRVYGALTPAELAAGTALMAARGK
jgi:cytochrome c biogenesis protein CcmG/thiol:disulfide interchange protein DsbE